MSRCIILCPIGSVRTDILDRIAACIESRSGLTCSFFMAMETPRYAYDETRGQYNAKIILRRLMARCPEECVRFIGVTHVDLFVPILKYVFGLAEIKGQCAIISTHRLQPEFYGAPPDSLLLTARAEKTAVHELGHCLGLTHCRDRRCVMYSSSRIEQTDFKSADFCPTCHELFRWNLDGFVEPPGC